MWSIDRCVHEDAALGMLDAGGISNMWCKEADKKDDHTGALRHMLKQADRQKDLGYLTPGMLGLMVVLCCLGWSEYSIQL